MEKLAVFDIDGTISSEGRDSWFEITERLVTDKSKFAEGLKTWKEKKASNPYGESLIMMELAVSLFPEATSSNDFKSFASKCFEEWMNEVGFIRDAALVAIRKNIEEGNQVVFATTSYKEAGEALVENLKIRGLIDKSVSIIVTGTEVNWKTRKLDHFNMGDGKLEGVSRVTGIDESVIKKLILESYGDDPSGNDSGILKYAESAYIISTEKNRQFDETLLNAKRLTW